MSNKQLPSQYDVIELAAFGEAQQLSVSTREMGELLPDDILVRNLATSINPIDYKTRQGLGWAAQHNGDKLPFILGYDLMGEVVAMGSAVSDFSVGDSVVGLVGFPLTAGCYAQFVVATATQLVKIKRCYHALSSLPLAGLTAYQGLFEHGQLQAGERVVISGASGGVGFLAVQLALSAGAQVIALASRGNHAKLLALGDLTVLDYRELEQLSRLPTIDVWFDLIGGDKAIAQLSAANQIKRLVTVPTVTKDQVCSATEHTIPHRTGMLVSPNQSQLEILVKAVENNKLCLNIAKYIGYNSAVIGHQLAESGELSGKIVLTL